MKLTPLSGTFAAVSLAVLLLLSGCANAFRASRTDQHTVEHIPNTAIIINTRNGHVTIAGDPNLTDVVIEAAITAGGRSTNDANDRLSRTRLGISRDTAGKLTITPTFPTPNRSHDGASITVHIPHASTVKIVTSNGSVTAHGLNAPLTATASNGRINVYDWIGHANLTTSNGRVTIAGLTGNLTVRTSNGRVQVDDLGGSADVQTSNGRIAVTLRPDQPGPLNLHSSNGSITAHVGPAFIGTMSLRTSNSSLTIDDAASIIAIQNVDRRSAQLTFTNDGPASLLRTSNGRIAVRTYE